MRACDEKRRPAVQKDAFPPSSRYAVIVIVNVRTITDRRNRKYRRDDKFNATDPAPRRDRGAIIAVFEPSGDDDFDEKFWTRVVCFLKNIRNCRLFDRLFTRFIVIRRVTQSNPRVDEKTGEN